MSTKTHRSKAERTGRWLGGMWRAGARLDRKAQGWLAVHGLGEGLAAGLLWTVKLAVLAVSLYAAFWLALLLAFAIASAWVIRNADWDEEPPEPEWKNGPAGFGLYTYDGYRIDPHVTDKDS